MSKTKKSDPKPDDAVHAEAGGVGLKVANAREGFRRGGRAWPAGVTTVPLAELTIDQIDQIEGETLFTVERVALDVPAPLPEA